MFVVKFELLSKMVSVDFDKKEDALKFFDERIQDGWKEFENIFLSINVSREELELYY